MRRVIVGFSGGVTSAWCAGWALRTFPREEVVLLWHDTKEEHRDTYRFLREMAAALEMPITERSDGRSVTQLFRDEGYLGNSKNTYCSRVLKAEQGAKFVRDLQAQGFDEIIKVVGYSAKEPARVESMVGKCFNAKIKARFPVIEGNVTKQDCVDWCLSMGVKPSSMYCWSEHANCVGCVKGGKAYWIKVAQNEPEVFAQRVELEKEFGHYIVGGGQREHFFLEELVQIGLKREVNIKEPIDIGACECGD